MSDEKVRHRGTPAEPWATENAHGVITRTAEGHLRITPKRRTVPAMAHVTWADGEYATWERLADLVIYKGKQS